MSKPKQDKLQKLVKQYNDIRIERELLRNQEDTIKAASDLELQRALEKLAAKTKKSMAIIVTKRNKLSAKMEKILSATYHIDDKLAAKMTTGTEVSLDKPEQLEFTSPPTDILLQSEQNDDGSQTATE